MAMLTNPYETQVVQSLGVRIGPDIGAASTAPGAPEASKCPFTAMIPAAERTADSGGAKPPGLDWTAAAEARLANIPEFVRPMARAGIEKFARENGSLEVDEQILDAAREFFGM
jgi:hypothetical protein